jgi:alpha-galactosidase
VLEVNQHSRNNRLVRSSDLPIFAADAPSGRDKYVAFFNTTGAAATVSLALGDLGVKRAVPIDLWTGTALPTADGTVSVVLPRHGSALYRLGIP